MNNLKNWLKELNVESIYFGSGSRNSIFIEGLNEFRHEFFFDERSLAFSALGEAKLSQKPVVVCLTSGTAVSEVFSALIEAYYSNVKLIILSADRPKRLENTHAPQTIIQNNIFSPYVQTCFDDTVGCFNLVGEIKFPIHINIRIDDLIDQNINIAKSSSKFAAIFSTGANEFIDELQVLKKHGVPVLIESLSHVDVGNDNLVKEKDLEVLIEKGKVNSLIKFGSTPISRIWRDADRKYTALKIYSYKNSIMGMERGECLNNLDIVERQDIEINYSDAIMAGLMDRYPKSEISLISNFIDSIDCRDIVYIGNSMPIRYYEMIWKGKNKTFASRGANGIDGQIATAIGMARATSNKVHCIIGDITFLYDFNSLFANLPTNLEITIIDNNGGRIFERVNVSKKMILNGGVELESFIPNTLFKSKVIKIIKPELNQTRLFWQDWDAV